MFSILEIDANNIGPNSKSFYKNIKRKLQNGFEQYWRTLIKTDISLSQSKEGGNKLRTYRTFKCKFELENYLNIRCPNIRKSIAQFRLSAHKLRIETDRYKSNGTYIPSEKRICTNCSDNVCEDEKHFLTECCYYEQNRNIFWSFVSKYNNHFMDYDNTQKFIWLMSNEDNILQGKLAQFLIDCMDLRNICMIQKS